MLKYVDKEYYLPYQQTKNIAAFKSSATAATPHGEWWVDSGWEIAGYWA